MSIADFVHGFNFLRPWWLLAAPVLCAVAFWVARRRAQAPDWSRLIAPELVSALRLDAGGSAGRGPWPWLALAWTLAAIALAGPSWENVQSPAWRAPAAWVVVLDLSPSMASADVLPNRYSRARYAIDDIVAVAHDARVALVAFSGEAYAVTPLTDDVATVKALLPALAPEIMPTPGDHLAPAFGEAEKLLGQAAGQERRIIVVSDGFDDPVTALGAAAALRGKGIVVSVVGVGTPGGAPLRNADGQFAQDGQGRARLARLDVDRLRQLASVGGGRYVDLAQVPELTAGFERSAQFATGERSPQASEIAHGQDGGFWLLPLILVLAAFLARRGWL